MALISCPECGKPDVSDTAKSCPNCGYDLVAQRQREAEEKRAQEAAELEEMRQREAERASQTKSFIIAAIVVGGFILFGFAVSNQAPTAGTNLFSVERQATSITINQAVPFQASGKVTINYSCTGKGTAQFNLEPNNSQPLPIWQKQLTCTASKTESFTIPTSMNYLAVVIIHGDVVYSMSVIQA